MTIRKQTNYDVASSQVQEEQVIAGFELWDLHDGRSQLGKHVSFIVKVPRLRNQDRIIEARHFSFIVSIQSTPNKDTHPFMITVSGRG